MYMQRVAIIIVYVCSQLILYSNMYESENITSLAS